MRAHRYQSEQWIYSGLKLPARTPLQ
uniref:Uncharacterized protein n=1 Tax=Anguilla anguilla TaxID=7936 RepID=A0A0E9TAK9_ANGAN